jgi:hypothetical protein
MQLDNFDFENSSIIRPPTNEDRTKFNKNCSTKNTTFLLIDSRDRDLSLYPNNNEFTIKLDEPIRDVCEIELISANMPINSYNINDNNNRIYFIRTLDDSTNFNLINNLYSTDRLTINRAKVFYILITPNMYDIPSLITFLNTDLHPVYNLSNNSSPLGEDENVMLRVNFASQKFNIKIRYYTMLSYDPPLTTNANADHLTYTENNILHFRGDGYINNDDKIIYRYLPNSAHEILGFNLNHLYNITTNELVNFNDSDSENLPTNDEYLYAIRMRDNYNLHQENNAIDTLNYQITTIHNISNTSANLRSNEYVLLHLTNFPKFTNKISSSNIVQNAYAKLHLGTGYTRNIFFGRIKAFTNVYELNPTIKLNKMQLKFTDYFGNLFNFNNLEFSLTFSITYKIQPAFYNY